MFYFGPMMRKEINKTLIKDNSLYIISVDCLWSTLKVSPSRINKALQKRWIRRTECCLGIF